MAEGRGVACAFLVALATAAPAAPAAAETLRGSVVAVNGRNIEILVDGPRRPIAGDRARVILQPWAGDPAVVGTWRIEAVDGARARAAPVGQVGEPWPGQAVEIDSATPREGPSTTAQDPWLERLRAEAAAIGPPRPPAELPPPGVPPPAVQPTPAHPAAPSAHPSTPEPARLPSAVAVVREVEPNDTIAQATPIAPDSVVTGTIQPRNDADHYRVEVSRRGELRLHFTDSPPELDMAVQVLAADGRLVQRWQSARAPGVPFETFVDLPAPGAYVLEVRDGFNNAQSAVPYRLVTRFTPVADPAEPNDTLAQATPLQIGEVVTAHILPINDADHYRVEVARRGELRVRFLKSPPELDMAVQVLAADGKLVRRWQSAPAPGAPFETFVDLPAPGAYVLEVRDGFNNARSAVPYELLTSFTPVADPAEPNDTIAQATPLELGQSVEAHILPLNDADFYRVAVPGAGRLHIVFDRSPPELDMAVQVLTPEGALVRGWQSAKAPGALAEFTVDVPRAGTYVLEVRDGFNNARSSAPYRMGVRFSPR